MALFKHNGVEIREVTEADSSEGVDSFLSIHDGTADNLIGFDVIGLTVEQTAELLRRAFSIPVILATVDALHAEVTKTPFSAANGADGGATVSEWPVPAAPSFPLPSGGSVAGTSVPSTTPVFKPFDGNIGVVYLDEWR